MRNWERQKSIMQILPRISSVQKKWAQRKLRTVPTFTTGFMSLEIKRRQSDNRKKCVRYAARLVWGFLGKNCRREHYRCVVIGAGYMYPGRGPAVGGRAFSGAVTFVKICQNGLTRLDLTPRNSAAAAVRAQGR